MLPAPLFKPSRYRGDANRLMALRRMHFCYNPGELKMPGEGGGDLIGTLHFV